MRIVAVEPYENQAPSGGFTGRHGLAEIGFGLVPGNYNAYVVDNVAAVTTADAVRAAQRVLRTDAIPCLPQCRRCAARSGTAAGQPQQPGRAGDIQRTAAAVTVPDPWCMGRKIVLRYEQGHDHRGHHPAFGALYDPLLCLATCFS